jgi:hypothetical protein
MQARWTVSYGPQFAECKKKWRLRRARFDMHLAAIRLGLERDPYRLSTPFMSENDRVIESNDYVDDGFIMTAFVQLDPNRFNAEVKWVELRPLPADDADDPSEDG